MADIADRASEIIENASEGAVRQAQERAASMPAGRPGDCELCGEWSGRLVAGVCAPCRDRRGLE